MVITARTLSILAVIFDHLLQPTWWRQYSQLLKGGGLKKSVTYQVKT